MIGVTNLYIYILYIEYIELREVSQVLHVSFEVELLRTLVKSKYQLDIPKNAKFQVIQSYGPKYQL